MYQPLAELIFQSERSDFRFENACIALLSKHEGVNFVPTSQSWDLGRDARATGHGRGSHSNILCATLNEQLDAKAEADILRLTALASPDRIVYCSSQKLSEHRADQITASLRRHSPNGSLEIFGATQLASLAASNTDVFEQFYGAELNDIRAMVLSDKPSGAPSSGLRLALLTFGSAEGAKLRDEVLRSTLLDKLSETTVHSVKDLTVSFSRDIGLARTLPDGFLASALEDSERAGLVERDGDGWRLTKEGEAEKAALPLHGAEQLLAGRLIIREAIERLIGKAFSNSQYNLIWSSLVDALSCLFHANGLEIIKGVESLLGSGEANIFPPINLKRELEAAMKRVASNISTNDLRNQTYRALLDIFTERDGPAFDWLTRVSERFVTLCAIGLERESGDAVRETLANQPVVPRAIA